MDIKNPAKEYHRSEHLVYSCTYHCVFCPKYRRPVLDGAVGERAKEVFLEVAERWQFSILEMEVMPDHVHLLLDVNPRLGVMEAVHKLKGTSSRVLREEFPALKSRLPCLWTRSCLVSSVGSVSLETVKRYIENQKGV